MKLIVIFLNATFLAVCLGKLPGYAFHHPEEIDVHPSLNLSPERYVIGSNFEHPHSCDHPHIHAENYKKQFFVYSAPDDDYDDPLAAHKISSILQKNLRVLFIRAPEQKGLENAALQLVKQASDDKTAIYVLHKQADIGDLAKRLNAQSEHYSRKPEVHFVKYRRPEDAAHAQQQIQAQYDALRGSSYTSNEGAAPVLDFTTRKQHATYGNPISVIPAYASVSNSGNKLNGLYAGDGVGAGDVADGIAGLSSISAVNSFSSFNAAGYNTNSITTTSGGGGGLSGIYGGFDPIGYNANTNANAKVEDNDAILPSLIGYGNARASKSIKNLAENANTQNSQSKGRNAGGGKFTFPSDDATETSYIQPK